MSQSAWKRSVVCAVLSVGMSVGVWGCGASTDKPDAKGTAASTETKPETKSEGASAATVTLTPIDAAGLKAAIEAHKGQRAVLVDFWATWCVPCREAFPHTVALSEKYAKEGLTVISVAVEDSPSSDEPKAMEFLKEQKATFANYISKLEGADAGMEAFEIDGGAIPHYRVYDKEGNLVRKFVSGDPDQTFHDSDIEAAVRKALGLPEEKKAAAE